MTYEEIETLILDYGSACENFGDYQSKRNAQEAKEAQDKLLEAVKKLFERD